MTTKDNKTSPQPGSFLDQLASRVNEMPEVECAVPAGDERLGSAPGSDERQELVDLALRVPQADLRTAKRLLQALVVDPLWLSLEAASVEEEELSEAGKEALSIGREQLERGETVSHEDVLREFGL
jgi:hypothetical protein